jgi:hypothetical protein
MERQQQPQEELHMVKAKDVDTAMKLIERRQAMMYFGNLVARGTRTMGDPTGRPAGDVFHRSSTDLKIWSDIADAMPPGMLIAFIDTVNRLFVKTVDEEYQKIGRQLEQMGVDIS